MQNAAFQIHANLASVKDCQLLDEQVKLAILDGSGKLYESLWGDLFVLIPGGKPRSLNHGPYGAA